MVKIGDLVHSGPLQHLNKVISVEDDYFYVVDPLEEEIAWFDSVEKRKKKQSVAKKDYIDFDYLNSMRQKVLMTDTYQVLDHPSRFDMLMMVNVDFNLFKKYFEQHNINLDTAQEPMLDNLGDYFPAANFINQYIQDAFISTVFFNDVTFLIDHGANIIPEAWQNLLYLYNERRGHNLRALNQDNNIDRFNELIINFIQLGADPFVMDPIISNDPLLFSASETHGNFILIEELMQFPEIANWSEIERFRKDYVPPKRKCQPKKGSRASSVRSKKTRRMIPKPLSDEDLI
jgi:hypothetical protein